jgi:hypothetical protein
MDDVMQLIVRQLDGMDYTAVKLLAQRVVNAFPREELLDILDPTNKEKVILTI